MTTGPVMGNRSSHVLTLSLLLMAAVCLETFYVQNEYHYVTKGMTWTEARQYCQKNHIDLVTLNTVGESWLADWLTTHKVDQVWIGLLRDPENDSAWKWINLKTGRGITGDNVSQSINWTDGHPVRHCAFKKEKDKMWHSFECSEIHNFFCSEGDEIKHYASLNSWDEALHYCKAKNGDLATITTTDAGDIKKNGWIGLYRVGGETWSWIGGVSSEYRNWAPGEPLTLDCASFDPATQTCHSHVCSEKLSAVCYDDNLVMVNENKTWEDALRHCKTLNTPCYDIFGPCIYQYNLLSLDDMSDYNYVRERIYKATTDEVWTGLRFLGGQWWWMSGMKLQAHEMPPACPSQWRNCGTLSKHNTNKWIIRDCLERRNFICSKIKQLTAVVESQTDS